MLFMFIATYHSPTGILGLEGEGHLKQTERYQFRLSRDKRHNFKYFRTHAQKKYREVKESKSTSILNILALLLFGKLAMHFLKLWSKWHSIKT